MGSLITVVKLDDLKKRIIHNLLVEDYIVITSTNSNYYFEKNVSYRADYLCIVVVQNGFVKFTSNGVDNILVAGDIITTKLSEVFIIRELSNDYKARCLYYSFEYASKAGFGYKSNDITKSLSQGGPEIIRHPTLSEKLCSHMDVLDFMNNIENESFYSSEIIQHYFSLAIYEIGNFLKEKKCISYTNSREEDITNLFFQLIRDHALEQHNVQYYADRLFISRKYLSRVIKKTILKSPRDIISDVLTTEAQLLLRNSSANIGEITSNLNFTSQIVFNKFFKKNTGMTPSEYRNQFI